jgi:hypothetical protein
MREDDYPYRNAASESCRFVPSLVRIYYNKYISRIISIVISIIVSIIVSIIISISRPGGGESRRADAHPAWLRAAAAGRFILNSL